MGRILNVGVVGLGRIGRNHLSELASLPEMFKIVAGADNAPDRLDELCPKELDGAAKYASLDEMLKHPGLDMVTIATRHPDHVPMAIKILEAGKIAVVEKPTATSVAEFDRMLSVAEKHPHRLFLRHNRRFEPAFVKVKELMDSGRYAFADGHVVRNDPRFVKKNIHGREGICLGSGDRQLGKVGKPLFANAEVIVQQGTIVPIAADTGCPASRKECQAQYHLSGIFHPAGLLIGRNSHEVTPTVTSLFVDR